jgi:hypothetical protein
MAQKRTKAFFKIVAELLIVFTGAVGVVGLFQDYFWFSDPEIITGQKIILKYFAGLLAAILHGLLMLQRNKIKYVQSNNRRENELEQDSK